jgi:hypothetical protein
VRDWGLRERLRSKEKGGLGKEKGGLGARRREKGSWSLEG